MLSVRLAEMWREESSERERRFQLTVMCVPPSAPSSLPTSSRLVILSALPGDSTWLAVSRLGQASLVTLTSSLERVRRVETGLYFSLPVVQLTIWFALSQVVTKPRARPETTSFINNFLISLHIRQGQPHLAGDCLVVILTSGGLCSSKQL